MGMFDTVICKYKLPKSEGAKDNFQTKSFGNLLYLYEITKKGILYQWLDKTTKIKFPITKNASIHTIGMHKIRERLKEWWFEYDITFEKGKVVKVKNRSRCIKAFKK